jgi:hypothetical protein
MEYRLSRLTLLRGLRKDFQKKKHQCLEQMQSLKGKHYFLRPTTATATTATATTTTTTVTTTATATATATVITTEKKRKRSCAGIGIMEG